MSLLGLFYLIFLDERKKWLIFVVLVKIVTVRNYIPHILFVQFFLPKFELINNSAVVFAKKCSSFLSPYLPIGVDIIAEI